MVFCDNLSEKEKEKERENILGNKRRRRERGELWTWAREMRYAAEKGEIRWGERGERTACV